MNQNANDRRAARRQARAANQQQAAAETRQSMADLEVLRTRMGWHNFASSLVAQFDQRGDLSDKQWPWVAKLAAEQRQRDASPAAGRSASNEIPVPKTAALFAPGRFARFDAHGLQYRRKNDGSVAGLKFCDTDGVIGRLDIADAKLVLFPGKIRNARLDLDQVREDAGLIEADPLAAAKEDGLLTGRCSCCGRELTDPTSIEIGIGPICLAKMGG